MFERRDSHRPRGGNGHEYIYLRCLSVTMQAKRMTLYLVEQLSGVSRRTVQSAKNGNRVRKALGLFILQAVEEYHG